MKCVFVLTSVTYAMKAQRLLAGNGIASTPVKASSSAAVRKVRGCGYGLEVNGECDKARTIISSNGIAILAMLT